MRRPYHKSLISLLLKVATALVVGQPITNDLSWVRVTSETSSTQLAIHISQTRTRCFNLKHVLFLERRGNRFWDAVNILRCIYFPRSTYWATETVFMKRTWLILQNFEFQFVLQGTRMSYSIEPINRYLSDLYSALNILHSTCQCTLVPPRVQKSYKSCTASSQLNPPFSLKIDWGFVQPWHSTKIIPCQL